MTTDQHAAQDRATAIRIARDSLRPGWLVTVDDSLALEFRIKAALAQVRRETWLAAANQLQREREAIIEIAMRFGDAQPGENVVSAIIGRIRERGAA